MTLSVSFVNLRPMKSLNPVAWPDRLCKYAQADSKYTVETINEGTLYFSNPSTFNDPFDCNSRHLLGEHPTAEQVKDVLREINGKVRELDHAAQQALVRHYDLYWDSGGRGGGKPFAPSPPDQSKRLRSILKDAIEAAMSKSRFEAAEAAHDALSRFIGDNWGICCLSARNDSTLMWSHYAGKHTGICLEFDTTDARLFRKTLGISAHKVAYYPDVSTASGFVERLLATKADDWRYEREYRYVSHFGPGSRLFKPYALKRLIVGCRFDAKKKENLPLIDAVHKVNTKRPKGSKISFARCVQLRGKLEIFVRHIPTLEASGH